MKEIVRYYKYIYIQFLSRTICEIIAHLIIFNNNFIFFLKLHRYNFESKFLKI